MKIKRNPIASAIKNALYTGLIASVGVTGVSFAQEDDDKEKLDRVVITGSRITSADLEGAKPVTIITREDIELSGMESAADILRATSFNSFGSFRERSGSSGGQAATINLRGLGSSRTAVLVNGRRLPGSPLFGTSAANLNTLPLAAIERVEVLTGGASSIYGADAIGGVVNIILRSEFDGVQFELGAARPERKGGDEEHGSFIIGSSSEKSNVVFTAEFFRRDPVFDKDRAYSRVEVPDNFFNNTTGVSAFGNTAFELDYSGATALGDCTTTENGGLYAGVLDDPFGIPGQACGFGYADVSAQTGALNRFNTFLSATYEINENHTLYLENRLSRTQTFGRYAPAAARVIVQGDAPINPLGRTFRLFHRFVAHGPRDENFAAFNIDTVVGMNGAVWDDKVNYDTYLRFSNNNINNIGTGYVSGRAITQAIQDGEYDYLNPTSPANAAAVTNTAATTSRDLRSKYNEAAFNMNGLAWELPAGDMGWAAGAEWSKEFYFDLYDAGREAGDTLGSAGNTSSGNRERISVFGELAIPLFDTLDMQLAARYDDYDDFGDNLSPSVSMRWQPLDNLTIRGSYTQGFKAPDLTNLNQSRSQSFNGVTDVTMCTAQGISDADCPTFQIENFAGGNPDLTAEDSEGFDVGFVWEAFENFTFGVDYYQTDISDAILQIGINTLVQLERDGQPLPPGTSIIRAPDLAPGVPGRISLINTGFANISEFNVEGFDIKLGYRYDTDRFGSFSSRLVYSKLIDFLFTSDPTAEATEQLGSAFSPDTRANFDVTWNYGDHTVSLDSYYVGKSGADDFIGSFTNINLSYVYHASWDADISVGVRNIADRDPGGAFINPNNAVQLSDPFGRTPFINYRQRF